MDAKTLSNSLASFVGLGGSKKANAFTALVEQPTDNAKLQAIVGDADTNPLSWSAQFKPQSGGGVMPNPLSPVEGDEIFFSGLFDGGRFQSHDGQWWQILDYEFEGNVQIQNVFYPRIVAVVSIQDIRRSIHSWIEPFFQIVPPPPPGVDYGVVETRNIN